MMQALSRVTKRSRRHIRLNAPVWGLEDNIQRYLNSPVMVDTVHAQHKPLFSRQSGDGLSSTNDDGNIHYQFVFSCIALSLSFLAQNEGVSVRVAGFG